MISTVAAAALLVVVALVPVGAVLPGNPTALWAFEEMSGPVADDSIGSRNGVISGASSIADGLVGRAFHFDGSDVVTVPDSAALRGDELYVSFWVRGDPDNLPADGQVLAEKGTVLCDGSGFSIVVAGDSIALEYRDRDPNTELYRAETSTDADIPTLWDGAWHHVTLIHIAPQDGWGAVGLHVDGWWVASGPDNNTRGIDFGGETVPFTIGASAHNCGFGFEGDIDQVRAFDHVITASDIVADEPLIQTTLEIDDVDPATVGQDSMVDVTLLPAPTRPGWLRVHVTGEDGVERLVGGKEIHFWQIDYDGTYTIRFRPEYGGASWVRVSYEPDTGPFLESQDSVAASIAKVSSSTQVSLQTTYIANEPIDLGVVVTVTNPVDVTGQAQLYEVTSGTPVLVHAEALDDTVGSLSGAVDVTLPARAAGTYTFQGRYLGDASYLPSQSAPTTLTVLPALVTGQVTINDGAATTGDPIVTVDVPATGATALWISNANGAPGRFYTASYTDEITTWLTSPSDGDDADGVRTIWIKWADHLGRWSATKTDSIILDRGIQKGTVSIAGGAKFTTSNAVTVAIPVSDPAAVSSVQLSNDGLTWSSMSYAPSVNWNLATGEGLRKVHVRWLDADARTSMAVIDSITVDRSAPSMTRPKLTLAVGGAPGASVPVRVSWTGSDAGSGVRRYELGVRRNGGSWRTLSTTLTGSSSVRSLSPGTTYEFRVRAIDWSGRASAWSVSRARRVSTYQQTSGAITYRGTWRTASSASYWGGSVRRSVTAGNRATIRVTSRAIAWVAPVGPTRGSARIYVNGTYVATVSLYAPTFGGSRIVFEKHWSTSRTRTLTVKVVGTAGHPRVDVDGFITLRSP